MKTYVNKLADIKRNWHVIDATDKTLGRLSTQIARLLMGKHKPTWSPAQDTGDYVVVINAAKIRVTGKKLQDKIYYRHSNYPGGLKRITLGRMMEEFPTRAIQYSVEGMIPHTRLGNQMKKRLRVFAGADQPHVTPAKEKPETKAKKETK
jgi:large subunit ribosomal protein L13